MRTHREHVGIRVDDPSSFGVEFYPEGDIDEDDKAPFTGVAFRSGDGDLRWLRSIEMLGTLGVYLSVVVVRPICVNLNVVGEERTVVLFRGFG